jgi:hypothetical protein
MRFIFQTKRIETMSRLRRAPDQPTAISNSDWQPLKSLMN